MSNQPDRHSIRRIVLPSGRAIEVVRFYAEETADLGLHVCPECACELVQPIEWSEAPQGLWELVLECPNCFWRDEGVFEQEQVDGLEEHLDDGVTQMLTDLRQLTQANMNEEIERFAAALNADLILPEDF
jgi:hypothetical protein